MRSQSTGSEPSNAVENRIGTLSPHKGFGLLVVHLDELQDSSFQFTHAVVRTSFDLALGQQSEPALHLIQPGSMRGSRVQMVPRMSLEPRPNFLGLVGGIVVQHQMDGKLSRNGTIDLIQEFAELDGTMVWPALTDHRSRGCVQRSEETGGAVAFVIVGATLNLAGQHGKDRLATAQRLNQTLLIHAQGPDHAAEGSGTSRRCLAPCRPTTDRWIVETSRCGEDAWIDSSRSSLPTRDCSN